jgi:hypothetical protein
MKQVKPLSTAAVADLLGVSRQAVSAAVKRGGECGGVDVSRYVELADDGSILSFSDSILEAIAEPQPVAAQLAPATPQHAIAGRLGVFENPTPFSLAADPAPVPALSGWPAMGAVARDVLVSDTPQAAVAVGALADNLPVLLPLGGALIGAAMVDPENRLMGAAIGAGVVLLGQLIQRSMPLVPAPVAPPAPAPAVHGIPPGFDWAGYFASTHAAQN